MAKVQINTKAPGFALANLRDETVRLANYQRHKHVVLIFNRGFT